MIEITQDKFIFRGNERKNSIEISEYSELKKDLMTNMLNEDNNQKCDKPQRTIKHAVRKGHFIRTQTNPNVRSHKRYVKSIKSETHQTYCIAPINVFLFSIIKR